MSCVYFCCVIRGIHIIFEIVKMMHVFCIHFCVSFLDIYAVYFICYRYGLKSSKSRQRIYIYIYIYIYYTRQFNTEQVVHNFNNLRNNVVCLE